jgi:hypothetical protein
MRNLKETLSSVINLFSVPEQGDTEKIVFRSWGEIGLAVFIVFFVVAN